MMSYVVKDAVEECNQRFQKWKDLLVLKEKAPSKELGATSHICGEHSDADILHSLVLFKYTGTTLCSVPCACGKRIVETNSYGRR
jgi:hypothetical protein